MYVYIYTYIYAAMCRYVYMHYPCILLSTGTVPLNADSVCKTCIYYSAVITHEFPHRGTIKFLSSSSSAIMDTMSLFLEGNVS